MDDIKIIIAKNIASLRKQNNMTQFELAEHLNYSDKAVSKWERGESVPDIAVLKEIALLFGVTVDYLISEEHQMLPKKMGDKRRLHNRGFVTGIGIILVWFVAVLIFVIFDLSLEKGLVNYLPFIYAVPVTMIVWLVFNAVWFNARRNFLIISLLGWTSIAAAYVSLLIFGFNFWQIFILGIPAQIIVLMWSRIRLKKES